MEIFQQSEYDGTDVEVGLEGLDDAHAYEVHEVSGVFPAMWTRNDRSAFLLSIRTTVGMETM